MFGVCLNCQVSQLEKSPELSESTNGNAGQITTVTNNWTYYAMIMYAALFNLCHYPLSLINIFSLIQYTCSSQSASISIHHRNNKHLSTHIGIISEVVYAVSIKNKKLPVKIEMPQLAVTKNLTHTIVSNKFLRLYLIFLTGKLLVKTSSLPFIPIFFIWRGRHIFYINNTL